MAEPATDAVEAAYERIARDGEAGIFIELVDRDRAFADARAVEQRRRDGERLPLAGRTVAVKGNIDVAGYRTTAGCPTYGSVAAESAPCVRALEAAGAVVVAITNLDQFATGLVGTRSPHGACPNAHWPGLISGGSSAGSAVAVARGLVDLALGTDTAGSGRVPAAVNGIVGVKPTRGWISTTGVIPACRSIDCVSVFARSVEEGTDVVRLLGGYDANDPFSRPAPVRSAPNSLPRIGGVDGSFDPEPFLAAGELLYGGAFLAERYDAIGEFIESHRADVDDVVAEIILAAGRLPAWKLARDQTELARLRQRTRSTWDAFDVIALPTVPSIPTIEEVRADPILKNNELGLYSTFVNLLDLCALTVPLPYAAPEGPPASVTLTAPAWQDASLITAAQRVMQDTNANHQTW